MRLWLLANPRTWPRGGQLWPRKSYCLGLMTFPSPTMLLIIFILALGSVSMPVQAQKPERPTTQKTCTSKGGNWIFFPMGRFYFCAMKTTDGGNSCSDNGQCQGECEPIERRAKDGVHTSGQCAISLPVPGGCHSYLIHGKVVHDPCI